MNTYVVQYKALGIWIAFCMQGESAEEVLAKVRRDIQPQGGVCVTNTESLGAATDFYQEPLFNCS